MRKKLFCMRTILILFFMLFLSTGAALSDDKYTVKVGMGFDPATVNMLEFKVGWDLPVILGMHEALMFTHPETGKRLNSGLAQSVRVINGKDLKFKLHKFAKFHTGDPVTAHDVKFTYEQCANPINRNIMAGRLMDIKSIEVLDDYNLIFRYYEPDAAWREIMWMGICSKKYYEKVGRVKFSKHPVGSGILRFVSRKVGHSVILEIVPNHHSKMYGLKWYKEPEIKRLEFIIVTDEVARIAMLETGELDIVTDILPHHLKRLKRNKHIKIKRTSPASLFALSFKPDNYPILKDSKLALAFNYGINRKEIIEKIYLGYGYPLYMFASKTEFGYDPRTVYEFDPARARRLVKESSYKPGTPLILTYTNAIPNAALVAQAVQKYMENIGVTIELQQLEAGMQATYSRNRDPREGHMTLYRWDGGRDVSTRLMLTIPSTSVYNNWRTRKYRDELNKLCQAQAREMNRRKRLAIIRRIYSLLSKEPSAGVQLFGLEMIYAMRDRIDYNWLPGESFIYYVGRTRILK